MQWILPTTAAFILVLLTESWVYILSSLTPFQRPLTQELKYEVLVDNILEMIMIKKKAIN